MIPSYWRRLTALLIDFLLIVVYACALFGVTFFFTNGQPVEVSPFLGQLIAFLTLTLPVLIYFIVCESSGKQASLGKQVVHLKVLAGDGGKPSTSSIIVRNALKFLPWEIAHAFVQALFYFTKLNQEVPVWVWIGLIIPQVVVLIYFLYPLLDSKGRGVHDFVAKTRVLKLTQ